MAAADAIQRAGSLDREAVRKALEQTKLTTAFGPISFESFAGYREPEPGALAGHPGAEPEVRGGLAQERGLRPGSVPDPALVEAPRPRPAMTVVTALQTAAGGILTGGVYALVGIGLSLIFGVMRIVNFSHGEFMAVGMYTAFVLFRQSGSTPTSRCWRSSRPAPSWATAVERLLLAPHRARRRALRHPDDRGRRASS